MKLKNILITCLSCSVLLTPSVFASSKYTNVEIKVANQPLKLNETPFVDSNYIYMHITDLKKAFNFDSLEWNDENKAAVITFNDKVIKVPADEDKIYLDGKIINLDANTKLKDNKLFIPLKAVNLNKDFTFKFKDKDYTVEVDPINIEEDTNAQQNTTYSQDDIYWLSRLVHAEAQSEPYDGKLAVANVILNRTKSDEFPNTVKEVIFDKTDGVQYTPTINGAIYCTPSQESLTAAKDALLGKNNIGSALYFFNPSIAGNNWIANNRPYVTTIAHHAFYN